MRSGRLVMLVAPADQARISAGAAALHLSTSALERHAVSADAPATDHEELRALTAMPTEAVEPAEGRLDATPLISAVLPNIEMGSSPRPNRIRRRHVLGQWHEAEAVDVGIALGRGQHHPGHRSRAVALDEQQAQVVNQAQVDAHAARTEGVGIEHPKGDAVDIDKRKLEVLDEALRRQDTAWLAAEIA